MAIQFVASSCRYDSSLGLFHFLAYRRGKSIPCSITGEAVERTAWRKIIFAEPLATFLHAEDAIFALARAIYDERGLTAQGTIVIDLKDVRAAANVRVRRTRDERRVVSAQKYGSLGTVRMYQTCGVTTLR